MANMNPNALPRTSGTIGGGASIPGQSGVQTGLQLPGAGTAAPGAAIDAGNTLGFFAQQGVVSTIIPTPFADHDGYGGNSAHQDHRFTLHFSDRFHRTAPQATCMLSVSQVNHRLHEAFVAQNNKEFWKHVATQSGRRLIDRDLDFNSDLDWEAYRERFFRWMRSSKAGLWKEAARKRALETTLFTPMEPSAYELDDDTCTTLLLNDPDYVLDRYPFLGVIAGDITGSNDSNTKEYYVTLGMAKYHSVADYWIGCRDLEKCANTGETQMGALVGFLIQPDQKGETTNRLQIKAWSSAGGPPECFTVDRQRAYYGDMIPCPFVRVGNVVKPPNANGPVSAAQNMVHHDLQRSTSAISNMLSGDTIVGVNFFTVNTYLYENPV